MNNITFRMLISWCAVLGFALGCDSAEQIEGSNAAEPWAEQEPFTGIDTELILNVALKNGELDPREGSLRKFSLTWENDGETLLLVVPGAGDETEQIFRTNVITGEKSFLVNGTDPKFSHDRKYLAYASGDGTIHIGRLSQDGFDEITALPTFGLRFFPPVFSWSFDRPQLSYIRYGASIEVPQLPSRVATLPEIHVYDVNDQQDRMAYAPPDAAVSENEILNSPVRGLSFGVEGQIFFNRGTGKRRTGRDTSLVRIDDDGDIITVAENITNPAVGAPAASPNGMYVASIISPDPDYLNYLVVSQRAVINIRTGERTIFTDSPYSPGWNMTWSPNGDVVSYVCKSGAHANTLCSASPLTGKVVETRLETNAEIGAFAYSPDGSQIGWVSRDRTDTIRVRVAERDGDRVRTISEVPRADISNHALGKIETVHWKSFDGLELEGLLIFPLGYKKGAKVPLIVDIHGGAAGGLRLNGSLINTTPLEHQMWAARGYAVFLTDYRKGEIAGQDWSLLLRQEGMSLHEPDALDVIAGIEKLIDLGIADRNRIAAIGHSYGATVLNQLLTQSNLLAVAISKEGTSNFLYFEAMHSRKENPSQYQTLLFLFNATPETLREWVTRSSPTVYAHKIKTPLLHISAGSGQTAAKREEASAFVNAINDAGGTAESLFFADDYHVITKEENVRKMMAKAIEWIDEYIGDESAGPP